MVQFLCSIMGGPQQYTGRPMDVAHKHLAISEKDRATCGLRAVSGTASCDATEWNGM